MFLSDGANEPPRTEVPMAVPSLLLFLLALTSVMTVAWEDDALLRATRVLLAGAGVGWTAAVAAVHIEPQLALALVVPAFVLTLASMAVELRSDA